jgi:peptide deformylase
MALLPIRKYGDPVLKKKASPVDPRDPSLKALVRDMQETMYHAAGVGLAANQVGVLKQVAIIDLTGGEKPESLVVLLNPEVLEREGEVEEEEGCLSIPDLRAPAKRASFCRVRAQGLDGKVFEISGDGLLGKALQHETDHLNGILFVERLGLASRALLSGKLKALKKETESALKAVLPKKSARPALR